MNSLTQFIVAIYSHPTPHRSGPFVHEKTSGFSPHLVVLLAKVRTYFLLYNHEQRLPACLHTMPCPPTYIRPWMTPARPPACLRCPALPALPCPFTHDTAPALFFSVNRSTDRPTRLPPARPSWPTPTTLTPPTHPNNTPPPDRSSARSSPRASSPRSSTPSSPPTWPASAPTSTTSPCTGSPSPSPRSPPPPSASWSPAPPPSTRPPSSAAAPSTSSTCSPPASSSRYDDVFTTHDSRHDTIPYDTIPYHAQQHNRRFPSAPYIPNHDAASDPNPNDATTRPHTRRTTNHNHTPLHTLRRTRSPCTCPPSSTSPSSATPWRTSWRWTCRAAPSTVPRPRRWCVAGWRLG